MTRALKWARAATSAVRLVKNPSELDQVFELADNLVTPQILDDIVRELSRDPDCARALAERPRIGAVDLHALRRLPPGTLGRAFADHMLDNGLDPAALPTRDAPDAGAFFRAHLLETHDVWHVVTAFDTDVAGELGLQAFYLAQLPARLSVGLLAGGLVNALLFQWNERDARMRAIVRGWLLGARARPLFGARWAEMWTTPLDEVRRAFGVDLAWVDRTLREARPSTAAA